ncbi:hypothetical protein B0H14DRAFT_3486987 [Mycena olivaceomarginata]|nr:hypothetical protein B0H14DRAFT_3486987 [Mycena olivaceomarginata]
MDDDELVGSISAGGGCSSFQFPPAFVVANAGLFLILDLVHPRQCWAFLRARATPIAPIKVEGANSDLLPSLPRVKSVDSVKTGVRE